MQTEKWAIDGNIILRLPLDCRKAGEAANVYSFKAQIAVATISSGVAQELIDCLQVWIIYNAFALVTFILLVEKIL